MKHGPARSNLQSITKTDLAQHLNVDQTSVANIATVVGLQTVAGRYPWRRIWRMVHKTEGVFLKEHHAALAACGSPILDEIESLEEKLKEPLWKFPQMARALGHKPDTFAKALREGRKTLPITQLNFGPRMRFYRPLEVLLWRDEGILLDLPESVQFVAAETQTAIDTGTVSRSAAPQNNAEKSLFGSFASEKMSSAG
ncbi:hypothetical protein SAMN04488523_11651 [Sulfitobacter brevis]|uniref:Uncharacterized protein n=1 Tax=Sulfitobacter brevis TaxID=74348 RepID=A0A1I2FN12_9RHOB|nr:hypothetical protein [Sulfitobacter brevis]SFF06168.1 hypothetical protein SAMN04488523_11651 [Sulfitobacter brevis]